MQPPDIPENEQQRLIDLDSYEILDTLPEEAYDDLTELAAEICGKPIALISLVDKDRQWFKSKVGLGADQTERSISFCGHAVANDEFLMVENATQDERFEDNPLVTQDPNIRFYAGALLKSPRGFNLGTLCVIDDKPGSLTPSQRKALETLARQAVRTMELRRQVIDMARLEDLHNITSLSIELRPKVQKILRWGCDTYKLPMGIVSHIVGDTYTVFEAVADSEPPPPGTEFQVGKTYCSHTLAANGPVGFHKAGEQIADHPCYQEFHLESYIGAPLIVDGQRFGTVNFSGPDPLDYPFLNRDFALLHLISQWISFEISRENHITELSRLKDSLKLANDNLSQKVTELDQFAYVVSHDLKAPLRAIGSLADWLTEDLADNIDDDSAKHLSLLKGRAVRMESLINGILDYSRIGRKDNVAETVMVGKVLSDVIESLNPPAGFQIKVTTDMPTLSGNRTRIFQLFSNLVGNAIKYHHRQDGIIEVSCANENGHYVFKVADDGPGIDPNYHDKIFGVFQTLQRRDDVESTGIGLSIVQKIVETNGGTIRLESDGQSGTTFIFTWPKSAPVPAGSEA